MHINNKTTSISGIERNFSDMNLEQYTDKAKETMVEVMSARALDHQTISTAHVMKAILLNNKKRFRKLIELVRKLLLRYKRLTNINFSPQG